MLLNKWMIRSERVDALPKLFVRNLETNQEEELIISDEEIISPSMSLMQKDRNTEILRVNYESPKTPTRTYEYNIKTKLSGTIIDILQYDTFFLLFLFLPIFSLAIQSILVFFDLSNYRLISSCLVSLNIN